MGSNNNFQQREDKIKKEIFFFDDIDPKKSSDFKKKEKLSDDIRQLDEIKDIGKRIEYSISEYFDRSNMEDPTARFDWEYILIDNKK